MHLYLFRPQGHGPATFIVMADNEEEARKSVLVNKEYLHPCGLSADLDEYDVEVYEAGEVAINDND